MIKTVMACRKSMGGPQGGVFFTLLLGLCLFFVFSADASWAGPDSTSPVSSATANAVPLKTVQKDSLKLDVAYLKGYFSDTGKILTSPVRWEGKDWLTAAAVVSVTAGLYAYDQDLKEWFQNKRTGTTNDIAKVFNPIGNPLYTIPTMGVVYALGEYLENEKAKRIGLLSIESMVLSGAFTTAIKFAGQRHRPDTGDRYNQWDGPKFSTDNLSFPSLQTSTAFSLARVLASESDAPYVAPLAYGLASMVALSRLNDNDHWSSDAFLGAAIGYFTAGAILRYHKKNSPFTLLPDVDRDRYGVHLSYRF